MLRPMAGRPSKYDPRYCAEVVKHMNDGASLTSFAAEIDVARSTINEWIAQHPEFSEAVSRGKAKCLAWWEKINRENAQNGKGNPTSCIFGLTNMSAENEWKHKQEIEHTGSVSIRDEILKRRERAGIEPKIDVEIVG